MSTSARNCETNGHLWGRMGVCIMCETTKEQFHANAKPHPLLCGCLECERRKESPACPSCTALRQQLEDVRQTAEWWANRCEMRSREAIEATAELATAKVKAEAWDEKCRQIRRRTERLLDEIEALYAPTQRRTGGGPPPAPDDSMDPGTTR